MAPVSQAQHFGDIHIEGEGQLTINQVVQIAVAEVKTRAFVPSSPYVGLRRFEERNKDFFFGRDRLVEQILQILLQRNFVLVAGPSGSGKSSVVRAGLIPLVASQFAQGCFRALVLTPDRDPFSSLRAALQGAGIAQSKITGLDVRTADAVKSVLTETRPPDERWVLVVDQFEEIFTLCADAKHREAFISGLTQLAQSEIKIVAAMRADFFDRFGPYPTFGALAQQGLQLVLDMESSELRAAIEQPAAKHGVVFEEGLVDQIIADVKGRPGALPLLQYTLDLLWRSDNPVDDRTLNITSYHKLGGVEGALRQRADAIYRNADSQGKTPRSKEEQELMRQLFLRVVDLTSQGTEARVVSRRASLTDFTRADEQQLIRELTDEKLLVTSAQRIDASGNTQGTVEIAHEALLSAWPLLKGWIEQAREVIYVRNRISVDAHRWTEVMTNKPEQAAEELWSGTRLAQALELESRGDFDNVLGGLHWQEHEFLRQSRTQRDDRERARLRTRRILFTTAMLVIVLIVAALAFALNAQNQLAKTEGEKRKAAQNAAQEQERLTNEANEAKRETHKQLRAALIEQGRQLLVDRKSPLQALRILIKLQGQSEEDPILPYLLATGLRTVAQTKVVLRNPGGYVDAKFSPSGQAVLQWPTHLRGAMICPLDGDDCRPLWANSRFGSLESVSYGSDGRLILLRSYGGFEVIDSEGGNVMPPISCKHAISLADPGDADLSPDGRRVIAACSDKLVRLYDVASGKLLESLVGHSAEVKFARYSPKGGYILTTDADRLTILWDARMNKELRRFEKSVGELDNYPKFSPDDKFLMTFDTRNHPKSLVNLWRTDKLSAPVVLQTPDPSVIFEANFSPDSQRVVTASADNTARIFSLDGKTVARLQHATSVFDAVFGPNGDRVATVDQENVIRLWHAEAGQLMSEYRGHSQSLRFPISFSRDGRKLVSVGVDKTARILDLNVGQLEIDETRGRYFLDALFSPDGATVAAKHCKNDSDYRVTLWNSKTGKRIGQIGPNENFKSLAYGPDGKYLLAGDSAQLWKVLEAKTGHEKPSIPVDGYPGPMPFSPSGKVMLFQLGMGPALIFDSHTIANLADPVGYKELTRIDIGKVGMKIPPAPFRADDDQIIVFGGNDIAIFSIASGKVDPLKGHRRAVLGAMFSPDGKRIVSFTAEEIFAWDANTRNRIPEFAPGSLELGQVIFSLDGSKLLVMDSEQRVRALSAKNGAILYELPGKYQDDFALSPDRLRLATIDENGRMVQLWDVESGRLLDTLLPPGFYVSHLSFGPGGTRLLAAGSGMVIFDVGPEQRTREQLDKILDCFPSNGAENPSHPGPFCVP